MIIKKDNDIWNIVKYSPLEESNLKILIYEMYYNEKKQDNLKEENYKELVEITGDSILNNKHNISFFEDSYFVVDPLFGLGIVEIPVKKIEIEV